MWLRDQNGYRPALPAQCRESPDALPLLVVETAQETAIEALWSKGGLAGLAGLAGLVWAWPRSERSVSAVGQIRAAEVSVPVETAR